MRYSCRLGSNSSSVGPASAAISPPPAIAASVHRMLRGRMVRAAADEPRLRPCATLERRLDGHRDLLAERVVMLVRAVGQLGAARGGRHPAPEPLAGTLEDGIVLVLRHVGLPHGVVEQREAGPPPASW